MLRFYMTHENTLARERAAVFAVFPVALPVAFVRPVKFARMTRVMLAWVIC